MKCLGITKDGTRCSRTVKFMQEIDRGCSLGVCYQHRTPRIVAQWEKHIGNKTQRDPTPEPIADWLYNFYQHWNKTKNVAGSSKFASATYTLNSTNYNYEMKYEMFIESLFKDYRAREPCTICYRTNQVYKTVECDHSFCKECIRKWMSRASTCPVCRTIL